MEKFNGNSADLDINFERNLFTNDVSIKSGEEAIRRALKNLIFLKTNEKPFHPELNSGISDILFENVNPITIEEIKRRIKRIIAKYEPRIAKSIVDIEHNVDRNLVIVKILYTINNVSTVFTADLTLKRTR
jgi:phage baseplate assembly protein W